MAQSSAEKLRRHREEMQLALQLKITPREARAMLDQRAARARWEEANRRLQALANAPVIPGSLLAEGEPMALWYQQGSMA
jgi:hypothetical protein